MTSIRYGVIALSFVLLPSVALSAETPPVPPGAVPATAEDVVLMKWVGFKNPQVGQLWNPNDPNIGREAGEVKIWLAKHSTRNVIVQCFDSVFAKKLKAFMEAVPGGVPIITDGYRDPRKQTGLVASGASKAGPCRSYHNYGLAADFNGRANLGWMRSYSRSYGINVIGSWDPGHFQDGRGIHGQCGACSGYDGSGLVDNAGASSGFGDSLRKALGMDQPQQPQQPQIPQQPLPQPQQPFQYFPPIEQKEPPPITSTTSPKQASTTRPTTIDDDFFEEEKENKPSIADKLLELAFGTSSIGTPVSIATTVPIVVSGKDAATLKSASTSTSTASATPNTKAIHPSQTFVSPDLTYPSAELGPRSEDETFRYLLQIRAILIQFLELLRPFGIRESIESVTNEEYYME